MHTFHTTQSTNQPNPNLTLTHHSGQGKGVKGAAAYAKALYVPEGGYDEEEDCVNAEDESYREALETMEKEVGRYVCVCNVMYVCNVYM